MGIFLKQWGLATESEYSLRRLGNEAFTRQEAERLARLWAETWPSKAPILVVNLEEF